jgi:hypothetical protein
VAKINFGGVVQDARGKQNGIVYSKNKSGAYVRRKVTPVNPQSTAQAAIRNSFATWSKQWSATLTSAERAAWTTFANTYPRVDVFGNSITLNGLNQYIAINQVGVSLGASVFTLPPTSVYSPTTPIVELDAAATSESVTFTPGALATNAMQFWGVYMTPPLPAGRSSVKATYRLIGYVPQQHTGTIIPVDVSSAYVDRFGPLIVGYSINALITCVDGTTAVPTVGQPFTAPITT